MCNIHISLRIQHTENLLKGKVGVYFTHDELVDYIFAQTGTRLPLSHIPAVLNRIQQNGLTMIHRKGDSVCFETESIRAVRLENEAKIRDQKIQAKAEKDAMAWAKKRQKVQDLEKELAAALQDLKVFEDSRQDSILRAV